MPLSRKIQIDAGKSYVMGKKISLNNTKYTRTPSNFVKKRKAESKDL